MIMDGRHANPHSVVVWSSGGVAGELDTGAPGGVGADVSPSARGSLIWSRWRRPMGRRCGCGSFPSTRVTVTCSVRAAQPRARPASARWRRFQAPTYAGGVATRDVIYLAYVIKAFPYRCGTDW